MSGNDGSLVGLGVPRLDELLGGGIPGGTTALAYGPPYCGKTLLGRLFLLDGLHRGEAVLIVLTDDTAEDVAEELTRMDSEFPRFEDQGLVHYVDLYSFLLGPDVAKRKNAEYVEGPTDLNTALMAVNAAERRILKATEKHRLLFDSVSTLMVHNNAQTAFRFLQLFLGRARQAGATNLLLLERGVHEENEVELAKTLSRGLIEMRTDEDKHQLRVQGFRSNQNTSWVDYTFDDTSFDVTGSFAAGRIK